MKHTYINSLTIMVVAILFWSYDQTRAQGTATISEYQQEFKTYSFDDPDPVPILVSNPKIYPYFKYEGYKHDPEMREFKVVKLENDYIEVYVLPEVGGKVWGAIEKSTGEEFIYKNEVMKFRNISMRGPWTSGGIEFNFGIIGHHPSTATPVDYTTQTYEDGSVSCTVGNVDLPSHTQWRVEIYLFPDKAYFETRVLWYNPTHFTQSYYNWMTGAAAATEDLEFFCPGNAYVGHPGDRHDWPVDMEGRQLSLYKDNNFGPSKSYHVVGEYNDFFGGYYHNKDFGFGHWAPYDEMPGQKLWLWALSRSGGIWEDLLTDTDGQYIEFQAGRLFNQFSPGRVQTPITQADFEPGRADLWREIWFPVKQIGGLTEVSPQGILHVKEVGDSIQIGINALTKTTGNLIVGSEGTQVYSTSLDLAPMGVKQMTIVNPGSHYEIEIKEMDLKYSSKPGTLVLDRDFSGRQDGETHTASSLYRQAREELEFRNYEEAKQLLNACLEIDSSFIEAWSSRADLKLRQNLPEEALADVKKALKIDTYDAEANFVAGKIYGFVDDDTNALECFGWAARSLSYRADAYAAMAEIHLKKSDVEQAAKYGRNALDFNRFHMSARRVLTIIARISANNIGAIRQISAIRAMDPLNHFAKMEQFLITRSEGDKEAFLESNRSELKYQTFLELAVVYFDLGRTQDAVEVLKLAPEHPLVDLWLAYLEQKSDPYLYKVAEASPEFVFPYRIETLKALQWAAEVSDSWKIDYYQALNQWALGHKESALQILNQFGEKLHFPALYLTRAVLKENSGEDGLPDLEHALQINKDNWRAWDDLLTYLQKKGLKEKFLVAAKEAYERMPDNYVMEMQYANALIENNQYLAAVDILTGVHVLPFEGASLGHRLWEQANLAAGLEFIKKGDYKKSVDLLGNAQKWPENLGVGKPYNPDDRLADYLLGYCYQKMKKPELAKSHLNAVANYREESDLGTGLNDLLNIKLARGEGRALQFDSASQGRRGVIEDYLQAYQSEDTKRMEALVTDNPNVFSDLMFDLIKKAVELD